MLIHHAKDLELEVEVFRGSLDHECAVGYACCEVGDRCDATNGSSLFGFCHGLFFDLAIHVFGDGIEATGEGLLIDIDQIDLISTLGKNVGDSISHRARTDHGDFFVFLDHCIL